MLSTLAARPAVPAGMIETAAGHILPDSGFARLLAALDEAHEVTDHVEVTLLGSAKSTWQFATGDHVGRNSCLHFGNHCEVLPDSTIPGSGGGTIKWRGGHTIGNKRLERFLYDGCAMTIAWEDSRQAI